MIQTQTHSEKACRKSDYRKKTTTKTKLKGQKKKRQKRIVRWRKTEKDWGEKENTVHFKIGHTIKYISTLY